MYPPVTIRILALALCGWLLAGEASALSLGRAHAAALIGRPLSVTIPLSIEPGELENLCPSAELFYGDSRVSPPSVRWEATGATQGVLRLESSTPVDEPTVTVYLRVGCKQASTRRYVLLAEPPPQDEPVARSPVTMPAFAAPAPAPGQPAPPIPAPRASPQRRDPAASAPAATARPQPAARAQPPVTTKASRVPRKAAPGPQARLKLEPVDLAIERDPVLRISAELAAPASVDGQQRAGLSALWQALQKSPEESVQDAARLQGLAHELDSVRAATRQNAADLAALRAHVDRAESDRRTATTLVVFLGGLVLALVAWMAWRWYRARQLEQVGLWFEAHGNSVQADLPTAPDTAPAPHPASSAGGGAPAAPTTRAPMALAAPRAVASGWIAGDEFQASRGGTMRMVGVQELIDVHDKADFFLSIGETGQAIAALEAHVHDQVETGALAWMDLLDLYHSLGRRADFERLRGEFRQRFTAQVPDFDHFDQPTASLENYSRALSRIVALWPSRRVLDAIEESIFRKPGLPGTEPFSLEAYRELVLLYHIARDLLPEENGAATQATGPAAGLRDTSMQPLHTLDRPDEAPLSEHERLMIPPSSARLGVDIDLDDSEPPATEEPSLDFDISTFDPASGPTLRR